MAPTVSVVVATYNFERFIARAIDSVLAQDYPAEALEIIVVDDGSTDGTPQLMRAYDDRVTYIRKENGGHLSTFNRGIGEATGDYIALLDGDDEWLPHKLRVQVALLEARPDVGLVHSDMRVVDDEGVVLADSFFNESGITNVEGDLLWALMRCNSITTSSVLVRASLRDRFHPIPSWARVQDWWISLCVAEVAGIGCIHEPTVDYRRHDSNLNHGRRGRRRAQLLQAELPLRQWLLTGTPIERLSGPNAVAAFVFFERVLDAAGEGLQLTRRELIDADQAAAEARLADGQAATDIDVAARHFVAALAHDPWNATARLELVAAGRRGGWIAGPGAVAEASSRPRIEGARAYVTLADAGELCERPELLAAYATTFGPADDATLVIRLASGAEALARLQVAVAAAGLDGDDAVDLLAVPASGPGALSPAALASSVDAVLSASLP